MVKRTDFVLSEARFLELLEAYGAALDRWPEHEREAGRRLVAQSHTVRQALAAEADFERMFEAFSLPEPSAALSARVAAIPVQHPRDAGDWWPFKSLWRPLGALGMAMLLGISLGIAWEESSDDRAIRSSNLEEFSALAFGSNFDLEEVP